MNQIRKIVLMTIIFGLLVSCGSSDEGDTSNNGVPGTTSFTFKVRDQRSIAVADAKVFLNDESNPIVISDQNGQFSISLSSSDNFHVKKSGHQMRSYYKTTWNASSNNIITLSASRSPLSGTIEGNLTIPIANSADVSISVASGSTTWLAGFQSNIDPGYSVTVPVGNYDVIATPVKIDLAESNAFWGMTSNVAIMDSLTSTADVTINKGGKMFSVSATGGYANGDIILGYQLYRKPNFRYFLTSGLATFNATDAISDQIVTIPNAIANNEIYTNLFIQSQDGILIRGLKVPFASVDDLNNAAVAQNFTLLDFGINLVSPQSGQTNVALTPSFSWSITDNSVTGVTLRLKPQASSDYVWIAHIDPSISSVQYPAKAPVLLSNTTYLLTLSVSKDEYDAVGNLQKGYRNAILNTEFTTGS